MATMGFIQPAQETSLSTPVTNVVLVPETFTHAIAFGQTGSGKTTGFIYPNLQNRLALGHGILLYDYVINLDNKYLVLEWKNNIENRVRLQELFKNAMFLAALSMLESNSYENDMEQIAEASKSLARVVMPMIHLGEVIKA